MTFEIGLRVNHQTFGKGTVVHIKKRGRSPCLVYVKFDRGKAFVPKDWNGIGIPNPDLCTYEPVTKSFRDDSEMFTVVTED